MDSVREIPSRRRIHFIVTYTMNQRKSSLRSNVARALPPAASAIMPTPVPWPVDMMSDMKSTALFLLCGIVCAQPAPPAKKAPATEVAGIHVNYDEDKVGAY